jgi:hypothetical protein
MIFLRPREEWPDMAYSLTWLLQVLLDAGLKVAPVDGWEVRGNGDVRTTVGVICLICSSGIGPVSSRS